MGSSDPGGGDLSDPDLEVEKGLWNQVEGVKGGVPLALVLQPVSLILSRLEEEQEQVVREGLGQEAEPLESFLVPKANTPFPSPSP